MTVVAAARPRAAAEGETRVVRHLDEIAPAWESLADDTGATPFDHPGWISAWWRAFGSGRVELHTIWRDGALVAVLPLYRHRGVLRSMSNWHSPQLGVVARDHSDERALIQRVLDTRPRQVSIAFVVDDPPRTAAWRTLAAVRRMPVLVRTLESSPYIDLDGDWEAFSARLRPSLRRRLARASRTLDSMGGARLEVNDDPERVDELFAQVVKLEGLGWKQRSRTAIACDPRILRFYLDVSRWAAERGWLRIVVLRSGRRPIAAHLALEHAGIHYPLKGGYDPDYARCSPGLLLIHRSLERAHTAGLRRFELLGDAEPYKLEWTSARSRRVLFQAFSPSVAGIGDWACYALGRPLAKQARVDRFVKRLRR